MSHLILVALSAVGLVILGWRVVAIGAARTWGARWTAIGRCMLDWGLSLGLAFIGGMTGGVMGGAAGLVAGPVVSLLVSRNKQPHVEERQWDQQLKDIGSTRTRAAW